MIIFARKIVYTQYWTTPLFKTIPKPSSRKKQSKMKMHTLLYANTKMPSYIKFNTLDSDSKLFLTKNDFESTIFHSKEKNRLCTFGIK